MHLVVICIDLVILIALMGLIAQYLRYSVKGELQWIPPYIGTFKRERKLIMEKLHLKKDASFLDLGCGDGGMLRLFSQQFDAKKCVGYDINGFAIRRGGRQNKLNGVKNITLIKDDMRHAKLAGYDYIYLYLYPKFIVELEDRLFEHLEGDTVVICNTFYFVHHTPFEVIHDKRGKPRLHLYKK